MQIRHTTINPMPGNRHRPKTPESGIQHAESMQPASGRKAAEKQIPTEIGNS
jgi:hypothetical protein